MFKVYMMAELKKKKDGAKWHSTCFSGWVKKREGVETRNLKEEVYRLIGKLEEVK